jgi:hypothetical protein
LVLLTASPSAAQPSACPGAHALLAARGIHLHASSSVAGISLDDAGASTSIVANTGTVRIDRAAKVRGVVAGWKVMLNSRGDDVKDAQFFCRIPKPPTPNLACGALSGPPVDANLLPLVAVFPGSKRVTPRSLRPQQILEPGAYGRLVVPFGQTLTLAGGVYDVRSVHVGETAVLECRSNCTLRARREVLLSPSAEVRGVTTSGTAATVKFLIQAVGRGIAFRAGLGAKFTGTVYAPTGAIRLGAAGTYSGAFIGGDIEVGEGVRVTGPSSSPTPCPTLP